VVHYDSLRQGVANSAGRKTAEVLAEFWLPNGMRGRPKKGEKPLGFPGQYTRNIQNLQILTIFMA
jgi:hypothetical protein